MAGGKSNIKPEDGKQFSSKYQPAEKWTEQKSLELGNDLIKWMKESEDNMFFEEFLVIERDLYPDLIRYLKCKFTSFYELLEKAKKIQEIKLVKYGVGDRLNATMTKFTLTNNHGWTEKVDSTTKGKEINNQPPTIIFLEDPQLDD